jgi:hypothetical protein
MAYVTQTKILSKGGNDEIIRIYTCKGLSSIISSLGKVIKLLVWK